MNIIIATEKPAIAKAIAPAVRAHWPSDSITFFNVVPYGNILFAYPRGLKAADFPHIGRPQDRLRDWRDWNCKPIGMGADGMLTEMPTARPELLTQADLIVFACDPDHTGVTGFAVLMEQVFGDDRWSECPAIWLSSIDRDSILRALSAIAPFGAVAAKPLEYGRVKRYFDWNWNTNSLVVLGATMRSVGIPSDAPPLSKYALQLLYALRGKSLLTCGDIVGLMARWRGTGRYADEKSAGRQRLGSAASHAAILDNLVSAGLLRVLQRGGSESDRLEVSPLGNALLQALHPDCEDPDLPFRLDAWCSAGQASLPPIDKYIRTFFGKQTRFKPATAQMQ